MPTAIRADRMREATRRSASRKQKAVFGFIEAIFGPMRLIGSLCKNQPQSTTQAIATTSIASTLGHRLSTRMDQFSCGGMILIREEW